MKNKLWSEIQKGENVRQNLSELRQLLKKEDGGKTFGQEISGDSGEQLLTWLLASEDAKTRKNAALLMGECQNTAFKAPLMNAYREESQRFVKSSYLTALKNFDCAEYLDELKARYAILSKEEITEENRKHRDEELRELSALITGKEGVKKHDFRGLKEKTDVYLTTSRSCAELTADQVIYWDSDAEVSVVGAGVLVKTNQIHWRNQVRTYKEMLFRIKGMELCPADPEEAAQTVASSNILAFLEKTHKGNPPFTFRVEVRGRLDAQKKAAFAKKMAVALERLTGRQLINAVSDYELNVRLVENKKGTYTTLVKLCTIEDERFSYRRSYTAESIKPVNAAMAAGLAKEYMKEDAQVLDPFCGAGTMLIERYKAVRANTSYGIDYKADAIEAAKTNTKAAGQIIHYIQKDFFGFTHEYLFDEIFTDMPFALGQKSQEEIRELYRRFFPAAGWVLRPGGMAILYTRDKKYVDQFAPKAGFTKVKEIEFDAKEGTWLVVLRFKA